MRSSRLGGKQLFENCQGRPRGGLPRESPWGFPFGKLRLGARFVHGGGRLAAGLLLPGDFLSPPPRGPWARPVDAGSGRAIPARGLSFRGAPLRGPAGEGRGDEKGGRDFPTGLNSRCGVAADGMEGGRTLGATGFFCGDFGFASRRAETSFCERSRQLPRARPSMRIGPMRMRKRRFTS